MVTAAPRETVAQQAPTRERFVRNLRQLRAELQDLQSHVLKRVATGEIPLAAESESVLDTAQTVAELMASIERYERSDAANPAEAETLRHIVNAWEEMSVNPLLVRPDAGIEAQTLLRNLRVLDEEIDRINFRIGLLTIPLDVSLRLGTLQPGQCMAFHQVFAAELPRAEEREKVLDHLARNPDITGVVDKATGLIFAYSPDPKDRARRARMLYLFFGLATVAVLASGLLPFTPQPGALLMGWVFIVMGVAVHSILGIYKSGMRRDAGMYNMLGQFDKILDTRLSLIVLQTVVMVIALYALVFASGQADIPLQPGSAFLTGYSLDSFLGLFSAAIERGAGAQVPALPFGA